VAIKVSWGPASSIKLEKIDDFSIKSNEKRVVTFNFVIKHRCTIEENNNEYHSVT